MIDIRPAAARTALLGTSVAAMAKRWAAEGWPARVDDTGRALHRRVQRPVRRSAAVVRRPADAPSGDCAGHDRTGRRDTMDLRRVARGLGSGAPSPVWLRRRARRHLGARSVSTTRCRPPPPRSPRPGLPGAARPFCSVQKWMVPDGMTSHVHSFEAREGGMFRISLTYEQPTSTGKSTAETDTFHGRFMRPRSRHRGSSRSVEFESGDRGLQGEMTITYTLADVGRGHRPGRRPPEPAARRARRPTTSSAGASPSGKLGRARRARPTAPGGAGAGPGSPAPRPGRPRSATRRRGRGGCSR